MIDISKDKNLIDKINAILNSGGICEVKDEKKQGNTNIVVVRITRSVVK